MYPNFIMSEIRKKNNTTIGILYGGRSGEHEISLLSAASVLRNLDSERFNVVPISIDKKGVWRLQDVQKICPTQKGPLMIDDKASEIVLLPKPGAPGQARVVELKSGKALLYLDCVFPVIHGPLCEDGTVQGWLELCEVPYVGSGVLGSSLAMDKDLTKRVVKAVGIDVAPWRVLRWGKDVDYPSLIEEFSMPVFVKPSNMGSSVGVHKAKTLEQLKEAVEDAFLYDEKVLVEKAILGREIEFAVLQSGNQVEISVPGEIRPKDEFYSYASKYVDESGAELVIPARFEDSVLKKGTEMVRKIFEILECRDLARVDLFYVESEKKFLLNEVNTLPGFTSISMYPKLFEHTGISYAHLLERLIESAVTGFEHRSKLSREFLRKDLVPSV